MAEFTLEEWEWPRGMERVLTLEPFECECTWPDGVKPTIMGAVPLESYSSFSLPFFHVVQGAHKPHKRVGQRPRRAGYNFVHVFEFPEWEHEAPLISFLTPENLETDIDYYRQSDTVLNPYRLFYLTDHTAAIQGQQGYWCDDLKLLRRFRLPFESEERTGREIFDWLSAQLQEESSEAHFAAQWLDEPYRNKIAHFKKLVPYQHELSALLECIAQAESEIEDGIRWHPCLGDTHSILFNPPQNSPTYTLPTYSTRLDMWSQLLRRLFPRYPLDEATAPLCVLDSYSEYYRFWITVKGRTVSGHERMESLLYLRDWAQDKATPEEMAILFPSN